MLRIVAEAVKKYKGVCSSNDIDVCCSLDDLVNVEMGSICKNCKYVEYNKGCKGMYKLVESVM